MPVTFLKWNPSVSKPGLIVPAPKTYFLARSPPYVRYLPISFAATAKTRGSRLELISAMSCLSFRISISVSPIQPSPRLTSTPCHSIQFPPSARSPSRSHLSRGQQTMIDVRSLLLKRIRHKFCALSNRGRYDEGGSTISSHRRVGDQEMLTSVPPTSPAVPSSSN